MKIDLLDHQLHRIAEQVAWHQRQCARYHTDRDWTGMAREEAFLAGAELFSKYLGLRQGETFHRLVTEAKNNLGEVT